jgi:flagellar hook-associated protein 3 FlgL
MIDRLPSFAAGMARLADLGRNQTRLAKLQEQISSGKQIQRPSDDPLAAGRALDLRATIRRGEQYDAAANDASRWLKLGDDTLVSANDTITQARTLLLQAANGAIDSTARQPMANQLDGLRATLLDLANTSLGGRPIFAGTANTTQAYDQNGVYLGDAAAVSRTIADGRDVSVSIPGPDIFGTLFSDLTTAAQAVRNGDKSGIAAGITALDSSTTTLAEAQVTLGSRAVQVESASGRNDAHVETLRSDLSEVEDIDIAMAFVDLKAQETAYEAALSVTAKTVQPSLLDFLR